MQYAPQTLMGLWSLHKAVCRSISDIVSDARAGKLPGVAEGERGRGLRLADEAAALATVSQGVG
uniref:Uncharacterized protein n=1 Tax=viral metagenome TaxID=1070528 RepID=A0A6H1ZFH0_9ZZZZ